jgi:ABC-2 type transport system ATP-binding protein
METLGERFVQLLPSAGNTERARAFKPFYEREVFGRVAMLFDGVKESDLESLGETKPPSVADLFVALMGRSDVETRPASAKEAA